MSKEIAAMWDREFRAVFERFAGDVIPAMRASGMSWEEIYEVLEASVRPRRQEEDSK